MTLPSCCASFVRLANPSPIGGPGLAGGTVRVVLNGRDVDTRMVEPEGPQHFLDSWPIRLRMDPDTPKPPAKKKKNGRWSQSGALRRLATTATSVTG